MQIKLAETEQEIMRCFPVMQQLRPHIKEEEFATRVRKQIEQGYHLAYLQAVNKIYTLAGFRIQINLTMGRHLYVDDLVSDENNRSCGCGRQMLGWLINFAKEHGCGQLHLDSGVQRHGAHRFYFNNKMSIKSFHFSMEL